MRVLLSVLLATTLATSFCSKTDDSKKSSSSSDDKTSKDKKKKSGDDDDKSGDDDKGSGEKSGDEKCKQSFTDASTNKGNEFTFKCPADCDMAPGIWGTGWYTADSPICVAAVHSGAIKASKGGEVTVKAHKGLRAYLGTKANGIKSNEFGEFGGGSFSVNDSADGNGTPKKGEAVKVACNESAASVNKSNDDSFKVTCPPGCVAATAAVWGSGPFTNDSSICRAAIHAGVITDDDGGDVKVKVVDGQDKYKGSKKHGVESEDFGNYDKSFTVEWAVVRALTTARAPTPS